MPKRNLAWILIVSMIALLMWWLPQTVAGPDSILKAFGPLVDARVQIIKRYVEKVDDARLVTHAVDAGIRAMIQDLNDPHAIYLNEHQYKRFQQRTEGRYGGIGVQVWVTQGGLEVLSREPDSPALRAGILPGDIITHIDGRPTQQVSLVEAVNNMLNGPRDTKVRLTVVTPPNDPREISLFRAVIKLDPIHGWSRSPKGGWRFMIDPDLGIAYVRLIKFTPDVDERLDMTINRLLRMKLRGLVLDLRENPGGLLDSAREVVDKFLDAGLIVRTSGRKVDEKRWFAMWEGTYPRFAMAILVNGSTASAAEIVSGSLRDHHRAVVFGERTYGKGSVQEVVPLSQNKGAIKLTTAYYYLPNGQCIQRTAQTNRDGTWGVEPDVPVKLTKEQRKKWMDAWREIGREYIEEKGSSEHAKGEPGSARKRDEPSGMSVEQLLENDLQLRKAMEFLQKRLQSPNPRSATPQTRDDAKTIS